ncbi:MAG TPA: L,D-transpeptidase family protein [Gammaproteobacteria bacterium]|nr:L,D-transpeptidase family protein [Gammaproteobacteria bacterium]
MGHRSISSVVIVAACAFAAVPVHAQSEIQQRLRHRVEAGLVTESFDVMDERIFARETLRRLYPGRDFEPLWVSEDGLSAQAKAFIEWLETEPARNGLRPEHYHLEAIESIDGDRMGELVDLELALSDSFLILGSHFLAGRLNPETLNSEWIANRRHRDLVPVLEAIGTGADPGALLEELLPRHPEYQQLATRLTELRRIRDNGGWPEIDAGPTLRPGDSDPRIEQLRGRLRLSGDLIGDGAAGQVYDEALEAAVIRFQSRHGLTADGLVGRATLAALNVPIQQRINQIIVNLERWRWLPESLGERYVIVNIAGFRLDVVEQGDSVMSMRVVVGRPFRRTPVFSDNIRYLVLNPSWEVPSRIAIQDKLPLIRQYPDYLAEQGYDLLEGWGSDERRVDPASIDWSTMSGQSFRYRLRQRPGELNALGRVKFMFPNQFSVYLHDTPARELFGEDVRAFSSGCIRLHEPLALAELLLRDNPRWTAEAIERAVAEGREQTVTLPRPIPVHLLYWTVWVDPDGVLQFRDDIYERDVPVLRELREDPPT